MKHPYFSSWNHVPAVTYYLLCLGIICCLSPSCEGQDQSGDILVDLGTHQLHMRVKRGTGIPIVFEAGGGNDGSVWTDLADTLYQVLGTTIITYDRAGYGKSGVNPNLTEAEKGSILQTAKDLEAALNKLEIGSELIFVAHSYGGFSAAMFSDRNPDWVKGIVLIDANLKCFFDEEIRNKFKEMGTESALNNLKEQSLGWYYEALAFDSSIELVHQAAFPSGVPVFDLVAETPNQLADPQEMEKWKACHEQASQQRPDWERFVAPNCGHYIFYDDPGFVIEKIKAMHQQLATKD